MQKENALNIRLSGDSKKTYCLIRYVSAAFYTTGRWYWHTVDGTVDLTILHVALKPCVRDYAIYAFE